MKKFLLLKLKNKIFLKISIFEKNMNSMDLNPKKKKKNILDNHDFLR